MPDRSPHTPGLNRGGPVNVGQSCLALKTVVCLLLMFWANVRLIVVYFVVFEILSVTFVQDLPAAVKEVCVLESSR